MQAFSGGRQGEYHWRVPRLRSAADILVGIRMDFLGDRPLDYLVLPAISNKTWPDLINDPPNASASFYLFSSPQVLCELARLYRGC